MGGLVQHTNGTLYGVTRGGCKNHLGTIFSAGDDEQRAPLNCAFSHALCFDKAEYNWV